MYRVKTRKRLMFSAIANSMLLFNIQIHIQKLPSFPFKSVERIFSLSILSVLDDVQLFATQADILRITHVVIVAKILLLLFFTNKSFQFWKLIEKIIKAQHILHKLSIGCKKVTTVYFSIYFKQTIFCVVLHFNSKICLKFFFLPLYFFYLALEPVSSSRACENYR